MHGLYLNISTQQALHAVCWSSGCCAYQRWEEMRRVFRSLAAVSIASFPKLGNRLDKSWLSLIGIH